MSVCVCSFDLLVSPDEITIHGGHTMAGQHVDVYKITIMWIFNRIAILIQRLSNHLVVTQTPPHMNTRMKISNKENV